MKIQILPFKRLSRIAFSLLFLSFQFVASAQETMRANLFVYDNSGTPVLLDGNLTIYSPQFSNVVDWDDAWKMTNFGENFGIIRSGITLVIERRSLIGASDTSTFRMWNMQQRNYRVQFVLQNLNHPGLTAQLKDNYLNTATDVCLNGTTLVDFSITADPASASQQRFQLIYSTPTVSTIPVTLTGIRAYRKQDAARISWTVENEIDLQEYAIERSADGRQFIELQKVQPFNSGVSRTYEISDGQVDAKAQFYRVKATSRSGKLQYSDVAKIEALADLPSVDVYPNPVVNGKIQLHISHIPEGNYTVSLVAANGSSLRLAVLPYHGSQPRQLVIPAGTAPGLYRLVLTAENGSNRYVKTLNLL